jgi:hypothetical protein
MKNSLTITFLILCFFGLSTWTTQAQQRAIHVTTIEDAHEHTPGRNCHAHINLQNQMQADPVLEQRMLDMETKVQDYIRQRSMAGGARFSGRTIPVYVHVLYRTSQENISDAQIQSQIDQINVDFAGTNPDYNPQSGFDNVKAGNTDIQFVLAPNGIIRKSTTRTSWGTNDAMKSSAQGGSNPITPATHLNMWVCNIGGGILGYAQFPGGSSATDGVVMSPQYFGSRNYGNSGSYYLSAPFDRGRTTTHEIGHYLNLRHIWGDGGCGASDFVNDTPDADGSNGGCPSIGKSSCGSVDMHMNYMDYTNDACMYMFSNGQKLRMQACLDGVRSQLGTGGTGGGGGGNPPACDGPFASVSLSLTTDNYGSETSWTVTDASGTTVASGSGYGNNTTINETFTLADGEYTFTINDSYGDGICCSYGNGSYTLTGDGSSFQTGGAFGSSESTVFCVESGSSGPTCPNTNVVLVLTTDNYGSETSWAVTNAAGSTVQSGSGYANNRTYNISLNLSAGDYTFTINDSYGDGICCSYGNGSYTLNASTGQLTAGGNFGSTESFDFCVGGSNRTAARTTVEVEEEVTAEQVNLYPNPANNTINVDLGEITTNYTGRIVDATGRTVWVGELEAGANAINVSTLSTGMYYVAVVKANGDVVTKKFVKK